MGIEQWIEEPDTKAAPRASRIAIVLHDFSGGGSERVAIRLANAWARRGRRVTILCGTETGPVRALVGPQVAVLSLCPELERGPCSRIRLGQALASHVRTTAPDLIFGPGNYHLLILCALEGVLPRDRPLIACKLSNPLVRAGRGLFARRFFTMGVRMTTGAVDLVVAMSESLRREAQRVLRRDDVCCVPEPNLDDDWRALAPLAGAGAILCIGRLVPQKRFDLALRAFALLPAASGARLTILGAGPEKAKLIEMAARLGVSDRVALVGHVPNPAPYLAAASLLLCSSRYEGYPAVFVEALAAGVPIVTTDCSPTVPEIMTHPSFGTVTAATPAALAAGMARQLARRDRPEPDAVACLAERHRLGPVADAWLALFDRAVAARHAG